MSHDDRLAALRRARRVLVLGSPGAGKTHLSTALSRHLGLELLRLDDFFWRPGPTRVPTAQWRAIVADLVRRPAWVMDGTYEASLDLRLPAADAIVFIRSSRWLCLWRVLARRVLRNAGESGRGHGLTRFFVRYVWRFAAVTQPEVLRQIEREGSALPVLFVNGRREVDRLVAQLASGRMPGDTAAMAAPGTAACRPGGHA